MFLLMIQGKSAGFRAKNVKVSGHLPGGTHYLYYFKVLQYLHLKPYVNISIDSQAIFSYKSSMRHIRHRLQWNTITCTRRQHESFRRILHALHRRAYQYTTQPVTETHIMMWQGNRLIFEAHVYDLEEEE